MNVPELKSYEKATPEQVEKIKDTMKKVAYWKITPMGTQKINTLNTETEK